jgi:hypothetical protein
VRNTLRPIPDLASLSLENLNALQRAVPSRSAEVQAEIDRRAGRGPRTVALPTAGAAVQLAPEPDPFADREHVEQAEIRRIFIRRGAKVYWMSQKRKSGQTKGVPDLLIFDPHRGLVFVEAKGAGGKARPEQVEFREHCIAAGVHHVLGGVQAVRAFLLEQAEPAA